MSSLVLRRPVVFALPIVGALASPLVASAARAEDVAVALGVHLSVIFGGGGAPRAGLGLDLRASYLLGGGSDTCGQDAEGGVGPFGQVTGIIGEGTRFTLGLQGGAAESLFAYGAEAGWTYRDGDTFSGHGVHFGVLAEALFFDTLLRFDVTPLEAVDQVEVEFGFGAHFPPIYGFNGFCSDVGRPLRVAGVPQLARVVVLRRVHAASELAPVGAAWLGDARAEAASVPAFLRLRDDLRAVGAPVGLRRRAVAAARDEVRHARLCREVARSSLGVEVGLVPPPIPVTAKRSRAAALRALAIESWREGCIGEGVAARHAALALAEATDGGARQALTHIVRDEAAHAELAWSVLEHALHAGGRDVREALMHAVEHTIAIDDESDPDVERDALREHGRLDATSRASAQAEVMVAARRRLDALI